ncbi:PTS sugar transporter subunit IIA [Enterococcus raffinosus]|uniref:PTS sugar transporter subunit IIA n=1 Tax=Enterococcus TaxID=1350 RepID=UPI001C11572C|nr:PTS N-acetylglucosamine transporter subunit IIBC [Enterococcus raffinosus]MBU5360723.1 PTS N-acetylglucosamine transporter subunit IIBC [Enterococcus raffinosus]
MRKIIFASHLNFAKGLEETVRFIMPNTAEIIVINAYTQNVPVEEEIGAVLNDLAAEDEALIFTDLLGGSVNQAFVPYLAHPHIHLITGMNLPVIMTVLLGLSDEYIDANFLEKALSEGREQMLYVNTYLLNQESDAEDE